MQIYEDFSTDPTARGWHHEGALSNLDWSESGEEIGGKYHETGQSDRYVKGIATLTDDNDFELHGSIEGDLIVMPPPVETFTNRCFGLCNTAYLESLENKVCVLLGASQSILRNVSILIINEDGNLVLSPRVTGIPIGVKFVFWYRASTRVFEMRVFDDDVLLGQVSLTLPEGHSFEVDSLGTYNLEIATSGVVQRGWLSNLRFSDRVVSEFELNSRLQNEVQGRLRYQEGDYEQDSRLRWEEI